MRLPLEVLAMHAIYIVRAPLVLLEVKKDYAE